MFRTALALALLSSPVALASGFKCPDTGRIVHLGSTPHDVRSRCREPDDATTRREVHTTKEKVKRRVGTELVEETVERSVEVVIDEWTFDFGENRFVTYLRFENGRLVQTWDGAKGTKPAKT